MASKPKNKMTIEERAKQFMPFDALDGYDESISYSNYKHHDEPRRLLSEEDSKKINSVLNKLNKNDYINITYYKDNQYNHLVAQINKIDNIYNNIELVNKEIIYFKDIYELEII